MHKRGIIKRNQLNILNNLSNPSTYPKMKQNMLQSQNVEGKKSRGNPTLIASNQ